MSFRVVETSANVLRDLGRQVREKGGKIALAGALIGGGLIATAEGVGADIVGITAVKDCGASRPGVDIGNKRAASTPPVTARVIDTTPGSPTPEQGSVVVAPGQLKEVPIENRLFGPGKTVEVRIDGEQATAIVSTDCSVTTTTNTLASTTTSTSRTTTSTTSAPTTTTLKAPSGGGQPVDSTTTTTTSAQGGGGETKIIDFLPSDQGSQVEHSSTPTAPVAQPAVAAEPHYLALTG